MARKPAPKAGQGSGKGGGRGKAGARGKENGRRKGGMRLCWLGLLAALLGLAAPLLTPLWLGFDIFSQFTIHFIIMAIACMAGLASRAGMKLAVPVFIGGILALSAWAMSGRPPPEESGPTSGAQMRIMSFNTWTRNRDIGAIAAEVRRHVPDIVGMMEFAPPKEKLPSMLKDMLPYHADCIDRPHCYIGVFSRWPMDRVSARSLWAGPPYMHVVVRTPSGPLNVFVIHTLRFPWMRSQQKQLQAMARLVRKVKGPVVIMGDFNSTPFSIMMREFEATSRLRRHTFLPSWPAWAGPFPQLAIDHVFTSPSLRVISGPYLGASSGSDHFPVILTVEKSPAAAKK